MNLIKTNLAKLARVRAYVLTTCLFVGTVNAAPPAPSAPYLTASTNNSYAVGATATVVNPSVTLTAGVGATFSAGKVSIGTGFDPSDELLYTQVHGISGNYDPNTGVLYLTGTGTAAEYQDAFRAVMFRNTDGSITTTTNRTISFSIGDALYNEANGHFYELVEDGDSPSWTTAKNYAQGRYYYGLQGYLVTVTSSDENAFLSQKVNSDTWIGATDMHTEGVWRWVTGPEGLEDGGLGRQFSSQFLNAGDCSGNNAPGINGEYANWAMSEPNDCFGEDAAHFIGGVAEWNDYPDGDGMVSYYLVEYGGMPGDPVIQVADNMTLTVTGASSNVAPVVSGTITLTADNEDITGTTPLSVGDILNGHATDANGDVLGMAIYGATGLGQWQRSTDGGHTWYGVDYASPGNAPLAVTNAVLFDPSVQIRFVPNADWNGTATLLFHAWDQTSGSAMAFVDLSSTGGSTAFSADAETIEQPINAVNDAPVVVLPNTSGVLNFGGASEYVELPVLNISGPEFTVEAWVYIDNVHKNWARIIDFGNGSGEDNIILGFEGNSGQLFAEVYNGISQKVTVGGTFPQGQWVHVAAVWTASDVTIYQDGVMVASGSQEPIGNVTRNFNYLGKSNWADEYLDGKMTDVRMWSSARSQSEIAANMNAVLQGNEAGLMMYYKASEPGNTYLADYGPLNHVGVFQGTNWVMVQSPGTSTSTPQDSALAINNIQFSDIDAATGNVTATFSVNNGTLYANTSAAVSSNGTSSIEVTGTIAELTADFATGGLVYTPALGYHGTDELTVSINDLGNTGSGGSLTHQASIVINVTPSLNSAPVMQDVAISTAEDTALYLAPAIQASNANVFTDVDGDDPQIIQFTSIPSHGEIIILNAPAIVGQLYSIWDFQDAYYVPAADFNGADTFGIVGSDGQLWAATPATIAITVTPVNDVPVLQDVAMVISEDGSGLMTDFVTPTTFTDADGDQLDAVKITQLPTHGALTLFGDAIAAGDVVPAFEVEHILYTPAADFSGSDSYAFNATDGADYAIADATVSITVSPVNDAPVDIASSTASVDENATIGSTATTFTSTDVDAGDSHYYQLVSGAGDEGNIYFYISGDQLLVANNIDFERTAQLSVRVQTVDQAGESFEQVIVLDVNDKNDAPSALTLTNNLVDEQQPAGTFVGILTTADEDANDTHTLTLVSGAGDADNASFALVNNVLTTNAVLDFNTQSQYTIRVSSMDAAGADVEEAFIINLNDINQAPTAIAISNTTIAENNMIGALVGYFNTTDADANDTHTYTLVSGAGDDDNASFDILANDLKAAASFDFETKSSYSVRVRATDVAGAHTEEVFVITVLDATDGPTSITMTASSIDENELIGTLVGSFSTIDTDQAGGHTYALVGGIGSDDNGAFSLSGGVLYSSAVFNYEAKDSYSIRVRSTDNIGGYTEEVFTIAINDKNDAPTDVTVTVISVDENTSIGTTAGFIGAIDEDLLGNHTFTLAPGFGGADNGKFSILANKLQVNTQLNYEQQPSFAVRIRATDNAGAFVEKYFVININDVNEVPTALSLSAASIAENEPAGAIIGDFTTIDQDHADSHGYTFVAGAGDADNAAFHISGNMLIANASFNFEAQSSYSIRVASTDLGGLSHEQVFTIIIGNEVDAPVMANLTKVIYKNVPQPFAKREFVNAFSQEEGRGLQYIGILSLPAHGQMFFSNTPVYVGQTFLVVELSNITYAPATNYVGADAFTFTAFDGQAYSEVVTYGLNVVPNRQIGGTAASLNTSSITKLNPVGQTNREEGTVGVEEMPIEISAIGSYPNPFQGVTNITFELPASMNVTLEVYDLLGRKVDTLVDGEELSGKQTIQWNGNDAGAQYICRLVATAANGEVVTKTINLMQVK